MGSFETPENFKEEPSQPEASSEAPEKERLFLKEQFMRPEILELGGEKIEVHDIAPEKLKTEVPVVFAPGWSGTPEAYRDNIVNLAAAGRRVLSVNAPHGIENHDIQGEEVKDYAPVELGKLAAVTEALEKKGVQKVDAVAHSEAGIFLTIAATLNPERFRNLVFVDPAGMIGKDNMARLGVGFSIDLVKQIVREARREDDDRMSPKPGGALAPLKVLFSNPKASFRGVAAIANSDIHEMLEDLKKKGVGISIIHGVEDRAFPMERVQEVVNTDQVDGFYSVKGGHNESILTPRKYTELIDYALDAMEKKQEKQHGEKGTA